MHAILDRFIVSCYCYFAWTPNHIGDHVDITFKIYGVFGKRPCSRHPEMTAKRASRVAIQVHVYVRTCRFKSCFPHQSKTSVKTEVFVIFGGQKTGFENSFENSWTWLTVFLLIFFLFLFIFIRIFSDEFLFIINV